ncbi:secondary thiamine-phosphate synthase enzyme YjbQ [Thermostilla marina]
MEFVQRELSLPAMSKGFHPITRRIVEAVPEISEFETGLLHVFIRHTSASLTINESADPDVPDDLDRLMDHVAPEDFPYRHTIEGRDDMPAHGKNSLLGCEVTVPVARGKLMLGTWQGIFLCEHRRRAGSRKLVVTLYGVRKR